MKTSVHPVGSTTDSKLKWVLFRLTALLIVCAASIILAEILLRVIVQFQILGEDHGYVSFVNQVQTGYKRTFQTLENLGLFRESTDPDLGWEAIPGASTAFININSTGFRGDEFQQERNPGIERIAVLGDSEAFGILVKQDETVPAYLEQALNKIPDDKTYEVYNFGIPGYNTAQELLVLRNRTMQYLPDTVILYYVFNDALLSNPLVHTGGRILSKSYAYLAVMYLMKSHTLLKDINSPSSSIVDMYQSLHSSGYFETVKQMIRATGTYLHQNNIRFIVLIVPEIIGFDNWQKYPYANIHRKIYELASDKVEIVDVMNAFTSGNKSPREYWASPHDCHKNPVANRMIAEYLAEYLLTKK